MAKLGYTWFTKDWRSNMNVLNLSLEEKGFYRELIDECFIKHSEKIVINCKVFTRVYQLNSRSLARLLAKLHESSLIVCPKFDQTLTEVEIVIPSISKRLGKINEKNDSENIETTTEEKQPPKHKEKEKEKKKHKEKVFIPPTIIEFSNYFMENGFSIELANRAFKSYDVANWIDSKGNKILNWKQKCQQVWFKEENKIKDNSKERGMVW